MNSDRLHRVRSVRELQERVLRAEWAAAERAATNAQAIVEQLVTAEVDARAALGATLENRHLDPQQVLLDQSTVDGIGRALAEARAYARDAQKIADQKRIPWTDRRSDAEALRRLEERHLTLARMEANKREQAQQDESAGARHQRRVDEERGLDRAEADPRSSLEAHQAPSQGLHDRLRSEDNTTS